MGALAFNDKDEASNKDIAALKSAARKAGYPRVKNIIIDNTYLKLLLECFNKNLYSVTKHPLPEFFMFKDFDTQVMNTSWKYKIISWVKAQTKLLKIQACDDIQGEAYQMAMACISTAELFIVKLFDWIITEYQSMLQMSGEGVDSSESDWEFIGSGVKDIFRELQLLWAGG